MVAIERTERVLRQELERGLVQKAKEVLGKKVRIDLQSDAIIGTSLKITPRGLTKLFSESVLYVSVRDNTVGVVIYDFNYETKALELAKAYKEMLGKEVSLKRDY